MPRDVASLSNSLAQLLAAAVGCAQVERRPAIADRSALNCTELGKRLHLGNAEDPDSVSSPAREGAVSKLALLPDSP